MNDRNNKNDKNDKKILIRLTAEGKKLLDEKLKLKGYSQQLVMAELVSMWISGKVRIPQEER